MKLIASCEAPASGKSLRRACCSFNASTNCRKSAQPWWRQKRAQLRRDFLRQLRLIDAEGDGRVLVFDENGEDLGDPEPEVILENLKSLWAYAVGEEGGTGAQSGWISWRAPVEGEQQRTRWPVRDEWEAVRAATFNGRGYGVVRERRRRFEAGQLASQDRGVLATYAACVGERSLHGALSHMGGELDRRERVAAEQAEADGREYAGFPSLVELREHQRELAEIRKSLLDHPPPRGGFP